MIRKGKPIAPPETTEPPPGYSLGKDIKCAEMDGRIAVTPEGHAVTFLGYYEVTPRGNPEIAPMSVADRVANGRAKRRFVALRRGGLFLSSFLSDGGFYKILEDQTVVLPHAQSCRYGVRGGNWKEDEDLTRKFFGATRDELSQLLTSFYAVVRHPIRAEWADRFARVTFSKQRDNPCDLTGALIPRDFPFVVMDADTQYFGGHISLYAFYRYFALLCPCFEHNGEITGDGFFKLLMQHGADPKVAHRIYEAGISVYDYPIIGGKVLRQLESEE